MDKQQKPHGREEVREALIKAAAELFSEKGVDAVSLRMIADHARVNHGLIHRHFGSKETLRRATQERLSADVRARIGDPDDLVDTLYRASRVIREHDRFWRVMARTLLDGRDEGEIQGGFPFVRKLVERIQEEQEKGNVTEKVHAQGIVASILAYGLGMLVFERYILPAVDLDDGPAEETIEALNMQLFALFLEQAA